MQCEGGSAGGCCGGLPWLALEFVAEHGGVPSMAAYGPNYDNGAAVKEIHPCKSGVPSVVTTSGPRSFLTEQAVKTQIINDGPVGVNMVVDEGFGAYTSGVYGPGCGHNGKALGGHAVVLVGYIAERDAYLLMNSWGPTWGVNRAAPYGHTDGSNGGFMLLKSGINSCAFTTGNGPANSPQLKYVAPYAPSDISRPSALEAELAQLLAQVPPPARSVEVPPAPDVKVLL